MSIRWAEHTLILALTTAACAPGVSGAGGSDAAGGMDDSGAPGIDASPPAAIDAALWPDAAPTCGDEVCDDGIDNDCDGVVDNSCVCVPSAEAPCYTGSASTRGVGQCQDGTMICHGESTGELTMWGPCAGDVLPGTEVCDALGIDENCNSAINEGCECLPGDPPVPCGSDEGECVAGSQACVDGALGPCVGSVGPTVELCDGLDNDCDVLVDEGLTMPCGADVGACLPGESVCEAGVWLDCSGGIGPTAEACNSVDDDCDATTDEATAVVCGIDVGACELGMSVCTMGAYGPCTGGVDPIAEACDGADNDCDALTDEGLTMACGTDVGVCTSGIATCVAGVFGSCVGSMGPATPGPLESPSFCDGLDSDCDSKTDEGCTCTDGATVACGSDVGECNAGTQTCTAGMWGACTGAIGPAPEVCGNGLDEDCNGADAVCPGTNPPVVTCSGSISTEPLVTVTVSATGSDPDGGAVTYLWAVTSRPPGSTSVPASPTSATTTFFVDLAGSYTLTVTVTDNEGDTASCVVTITAIPPQDLHIQLVWDKSWGDADLHLLRPGLSTTTDWYRIGPPTAEYDCFFANKVAKWPPSGGAGDASLDIDDTDGYGPENINIDNSPAAGVYHVGVAYYCSHSIGPGMIDPGNGPAAGTVRIYCGGVLAAEYSVTFDETGRFVHVADVTWPGCAGMSINTASWTAQIQPTEYSSPIHCTIPCTKTGDCTPGEVCTSGACVLD
jgi:hypothetical protein